MEAAGFVEHGGWKYISKQEYKASRKKASGIPIVEVKVLTTKEEKKAALEAQKQFVNIKSRRNRRFTGKHIGEPTFAKKLKIELDEINLKKDRVHYRLKGVKGIETGTGKFFRMWCKYTSKANPVENWMPARYGLNDYKANDSLVVTQQVKLLPKSNKKAQIKIWGRTKRKQNPEALVEKK
jgi:hypothetical protein